MKIKLDRTLCDGFGICAVHAPEYFPLDEWGYASLSAGGSDVPPEDEDRVRRALLDCPAHAIVELRTADVEPAHRPVSAAGRWAER